MFSALWNSLLELQFRGWCLTGLTMLINCPENLRYGCNMVSLCSVWDHGTSKWRNCSGRQTCSVALRDAFRQEPGRTVGVLAATGKCEWINTTRSPEFGLRLQQNKSKLFFNIFCCLFRSLAPLFSLTCYWKPCSALCSTPLLLMLISSGDVWSCYSCVSHYICNGELSTHNFNARFSLQGVISKLCRNLCLKLHHTVKGDGGLKHFG